MNSTDSIAPGCFFLGVILTLFAGVVVDKVIELSFTQDDIAGIELDEGRIHVHLKNGDIITRKQFILKLDRHE